MRRLFSHQKRAISGASNSIDPDEVTHVDPSPDVFPAGIKPLYSPKDCIVDIVFVHGLTGDREKSWTAKHATASWPQTLLGLRVPDARVLTFGYDACVADWHRMVSQSTIANHSWNLLTTLSTFREADNTNERPIIFICHSLGGLVCEDALVTSNQRSEPHLNSILQLTRGIIFIGTPHHGSGLARYATLLAKSIGGVKQVNAEILAVLRRDSEVLARIQDGFHTMIMVRNKDEAKRIDITCFYETLPVPGIGLIVPQNSAILPGFIPIGIHGNHMDMVKFGSAEDSGFIAICGEVQRWCKPLKSTATKNTTLMNQQEPVIPPASQSSSEAVLAHRPNHQGGHSNLPHPLLANLLLPSLSPPGSELEARLLSYITSPELHTAAQTGREDLARSILEEGKTDVNARAGKFQFTALYVAVSNSHVAIALLLLQHGAKPDSPNGKQGFTPFILAAQHGLADVVQAMLTQGTDVLQKSNAGWTALHVAAQNGHEALVQMLLLGNPLVNARADKFGFTPLFQASRNGHASIISLLLKHGADPNVANNGASDMHTPLLTAAERGWPEAVKGLLDGKANVRYASNLGWTALHLAAQNGHTTVVSQLLEHGSEIDARAHREGYTALYQGAKHGNEEAVRLLLEKGADPKIRTLLSQDTPAGVAGRNRHRSCQLLIQRWS